MLSACSSAPKIDAGLKSQQWLEHQIAISGIHRWYINGRVAVKSEQESGTASLLWDQSFADYELRIIAPLGQGTYILQGTRAGIMMRDPENNTTTAKTAAQLLYAALGWKLHLGGLQYWIRGVPEPATTYSGLALDDKGRLTHVQQSGFDIHISRYTEQDGISLPEKLTIKSDDLQLKLLVQNWEI